MRRAINKFKLPSNYKILVDGPWSFDKANKNILPKIKGDSIYPSIAAASIIAKVYRDNLMLNLSKEYSNYLWERNSGYGTKKHIQAIKLHGITKHHRKSFAPIHKILSH
jgi:ribonuclease HII